MNIYVLTSISEIGCDVISSNYCNNFEKNTFIVYFKMLLFIFKYHGLINVEGLLLSLRTSGREEQPNSSDIKQLYTFGIHSSMQICSKYCNVYE